MTDATRVRRWLGLRGLILPLAVFVGTQSCGTDTETAVVPSVATKIAVSIDSSSVYIGSTAHAHATVTDQSGKEIQQGVTWTSDYPSIASVDNAGLVRALSPGAADIKATTGSLTGSAYFAVYAPPVAVASVSLSLSASSIELGKTTQATASVLSADGAPLTGKSVTWTSQNPAIAIVSATGLVTGVGAGSAVITATSEGVTGSKTIVVTLPAGAEATATQLLLSVLPSTGISGAPIDTQPVVKVAGPGGGPAVTFSGQVTASLTSGSAALKGTLSVPVASGYARFTDLRLDGVGPQTLTFRTSSTITPATANVTVRQILSGFRIKTQPGGATTQYAFDTQPAVQLVDGAGLVIATGPSASTTVTASVPGATAGSLFGHTSVNAVDGVASFTDLGVTGTGSTTLTFKAPGVAGLSSAAFSVAGPKRQAFFYTTDAALLPLTVERGTVVLGTITTAFSGTLSCSALGGTLVSYPPHGADTLTVRNRYVTFTQSLVASDTTGCHTFSAAYSHFPLTVKSSGRGSVRSSGGAIDCPYVAGATSSSPTVCKFDAPADAHYVLSATPEAGSVFAGWSGDCKGASTCVLDIAKADSAIATFTGIQDSVVATLNYGTPFAYTNSLSVSIRDLSDPHGNYHTCSMAWPLTFISCFMAIPRGDTAVVLETSTAPDVSITVALPAACAGEYTNLYCTIPMTGGRKNFVGNAALLDSKLPKAQLTTQVIGTGAGSIQSTVPDNRIQCFKDQGQTQNYGHGSGYCGATYNLSQLVTLEAIETSSASNFTGWGGACSAATTTTCQVYMDRSQTVTARFGDDVIIPPPPPPGPGNPGGSGYGGSPGVGDGTYAWICAPLPGQSTTISKAGWMTFPHHDGLDVKIFWDGFFSVYEVVFRNRYNSTIHFGFRAQGSSIPTATTGRDDLNSLVAEGFPGYTVANASGASTACIRVDRVRLGADTGPYR